MKAVYKSQAHHKRVNLADVVPLETPFVVYVEPSGYCNLRCNFCPQKIAPKKLQKEKMGIEVFNMLMEDLSKFDDKIKMLRVCGNGEPLTNKNIVELLKMAYNYNIAEKIELVTNGTLLNDNLIKNIPQYCYRIVISIEGLSDIEYEDVTGVKVDFLKLQENIKRLHENSGECIIALKSIKKSDEFMDIFGDICDEIYEEKIIPMWPGIDTGTKSYRWEDKKPLQIEVCPQIFKGVQVQANGDIVTCCVDWERNNYLGNIHIESFKDIWESELLREFRMQHLVKGKGKIAQCKECYMNETCEYDYLDGAREKIICRIIELN